MICCSVAKSCPTPWDTMDCSTPDFPVLHYFPEFAQTHVHWVSEWCYLTISSTAVFLSSCPQSVQYQGLSQRVGSCTRCLKYWSFSISHSNEYLGLISFRIDWFDLAVKGTLKHLHMNLNSNNQFFCSQPSLWFKMICKYLLLISSLALCFVDGCLCCAKTFKHNSSHFHYYSLYFRKQIQTNYCCDAHTSKCALLMFSSGSL